MRGWHLFHSGKKIQVAQTGKVLIGHNTGTDKDPVWEYTDDKRYLFGDIRAVSTGVRPHRVLVGYKVGFGCRTHLIKTNHRFRFGIVFGPPLPTSGSNRTLDFSKCVTNIAEFYVHFRRTEEVGYNEEEYFDLSYSI